jgi:GR25 family glycosyltransferase involved in LPS biosynthesis
MTQVTQTLIAIVILLAFIPIIYLFTTDGYSNYTQSKVHAYVINLAKNTDRMDHFNKNYAETDLASELPYQRLEAVNGHEIDVSMYVTPSVMQGIQFIESTGRRTDHNQITKGMIGCYLSHLAVYRDALDNDVDYALIFEDDAIIDADLYTNVIHKLINKHSKDQLIPNTWDIMLLGYMCLNCKEINAEYKKVMNFYGLHGYLISKSGMEKLKDLLPINNQIDLEMSRLAQEEKIDIYCLTTPKVKTGPFGTDLQMDVK